jgi:hypothetical protein
VIEMRDWIRVRLRRRSVQGAIIWLAGGAWLVSLAVGGLWLVLLSTLLLGGAIVLIDELVSKDLGES